MIDLVLDRTSVCRADRRNGGRAFQDSPFPNVFSTLADSCGSGKHRKQTNQDDFFIRLNTKILRRSVFDCGGARRSSGGLLYFMWKIEAQNRRVVGTVFEPARDNYFTQQVLAQQQAHLPQS
jgi:hypothetical protein